MKLYITLSVLMICFLVSASSFKTLSTKALVEENHNQYTTDSFDRSAWKWNVTEVISTESAGWSNYPSLAVDSSGNVHVAWQDESIFAGSGGDIDIFYKRWDSSSSSWTPTEVVSTVSTVNSEYPSLAVDSAGNVHIAWGDATDFAGSGGDRDIFYIRWDSSTFSWSTTEVVSIDSTGLSTYPSLAADSKSNIHIAWLDKTNYASAGTDYDIFYKRLVSSSSWTTTEVVSIESTADSYIPSLAVDSVDNIHIAWYDLTDYDGCDLDVDIFYKSFDFSSSTWSLTEVVSTESTSDSLNPSLAVDSVDNIHVVWVDETDFGSSGGISNVLYKRFSSLTSLWTSTEILTNESTADCYDTSLAVDSAGNIHVAWEDWGINPVAGDDPDIFYKRWESSSYSWTTNELVSTASTGNFFMIYYSPSIAVDTEGNVHVAWGDETNYYGAGADYDIVYKLLSGPPAAPELAFIIPNPTEIDVVYIDWNNVLRATTYHVYRSASYIWNVDGLIPIITVSSSVYIDTVFNEGVYYYVVVAENFAGNSSHSNCQYVDVKFPDLEAPELSFVLPNPTEIDSVSLVWDDIAGATEYYVYRSDTYIWSVEGLTPIDSVISNSYIDTLPSEGFYFYVVVSTDGVRNSTHSNCEYIQYKLPVLSEFVIVSSLLITVSVFLFVVMRTRKKKTKPN